MVQANTPELMPMVEQNINSLLKQRHSIREGADNDFNVRNLTAVANSAAETTRTCLLYTSLPRKLPNRKVRYKMFRPPLI